MSKVKFVMFGNKSYDDPDAKFRSKDLGTFEVDEVPRIKETVYYEDRIEPKDTLEIWIQAE